MQPSFTAQSTLTDKSMDYSSLRRRTVGYLVTSMGYSGQHSFLAEKWRICEYKEVSVFAVINRRFQICLVSFDHSFFFHDVRKVFSILKRKHRLQIYYISHTGVM